MNYDYKKTDEIVLNGKTASSFAKKKPQEEQLLSELRMVSALIKFMSDRDKEKRHNKQ